jgi:hypothetical protein
MGESCFFSQDLVDFLRRQVSMAFALIRGSLGHDMPCNGDEIQAHTGPSRHMAT